MAKKVDKTPIEHHWSCEECGTVFTGVNPPEACNYCHNEYFDNLADTLKATQGCDKAAA